MKSDAAEYCTAGIDVPSLVVADYPSGNAFNFSQSAARSVRPIAQNSQLVSNGPPYSFQNPWDGMPYIDRTTSAANFAKDIRGDQTHCHEYFAGGLGTSIVVQIPSEQLQNQRKRRPSSEVGIAAHLHSERSYQMLTEADTPSKYRQKMADNCS
jgi:hypothetical protein